MRNMSPRVAAFTTFLASRGRTGDRRGDAVAARPVKIRNEKDRGTLAPDRYAEIVSVRGDGWRQIGLRRVDLVIENDVGIR
jgi:hypothetical protein